MNSALLRDLFVNTLKSNTDAGDNVYSPQTWATTDDECPLIIVRTPIEQKISKGRNAPQFDTTTTVLIVGRVIAEDADSVSGDLAAELKAERLKDQIERTIINDYTLYRQIQQISSVRTAIVNDSTGEKHIAEVQMEMDVEYYQGPEDFHPIESTLISGMDISIKQPDGTTQPLVSVDFPTE